MVAGPIAEGVGLQVRKPAEDIDVTSDGLQRLQNRRQFKAAAGRLCYPLILDDAIGNLDEAQAWRGLDGARGQCRNHGIQQRQRDRSAHPPEKGPPAQ